MQHLFHNPRAAPRAAYGEPLQRLLGRAAFERARDVITHWPGYGLTPLISLPGLAAAVGVGQVWLKDETQRFGLGSFKALGGSYAVFRLLEAEIRRRAGVDRVTATELMDGTYADITSRITVTCATAGNHGKSVAWGARMFGCRCVIYVHASVSDERCAVIARYGAEIVRTAGTYDDAVRQAASDAARQGWFVVSDTSYDGYMTVPLDVMQGYTLMADEIVRQWPAASRPTHVFVQCGVGGLAAAVCAHFWETWGADRPRLIVVEPDQAACMYGSAIQGRPTRAEGTLDTIMTCLACGEVSPLAWQILATGADDFMTIPDAAVADAVDVLGRGADGDPRLRIGASGAAGLAALLTAARTPALRDALDLSEMSSVLLIGSEGAADAEPPDQEATR